ncbi:MAG: thiamine pyrophosphate-dependent dehydrogenase E1 component subunit alpha [Ruminococcaceae bacterium]|nr:thiamine pyrophosphate-dependent dehydrogenase E1 component subunit alpha [Oscillospiraceae bacterium]
MEMNKDTMLDLYRQMWRMRSFEELAATEFKAGKLQGFVHVGVGEEASTVGVICQARLTDYTTATHRGHGVVLLKGAEAKLMYAELGGRATGLCKGRGGSMHMADLEKGILGTNGILGAGAPIAMGVALGIKYKKLDDVVFCYFGDGQSNEGGIHEAMNMAGALKLPIIFVCTNNQYGMWTPLTKASANVDLAKRAEGYGIPGAAVDGNDVLAVWESAGVAIDRARKGEGPSFLELKTYRYYPHSVGLPDPWRPKEEIEEWRTTRDPIDRFGKVLMAQDVKQETLEAIEKETVDEMQEAFNWAMQQPFPDVTQAYQDVYTNLAVEGRTV